MFSPSSLLGNKPVFYIILLILLPFLGRAQMNLVPNGSFEEYWECPTANDLNDGQLEKCKYWWKPTLGTSDYFNRCNTNGLADVPDNLYGNQEPFHGDGYVGFVLIAWNNSTTLIERNEYIQCQLLQPLSPCKEYKFSMNVTLAEASTHAMGKIGATFTINPIGEPGDDYLNVEPKIVNSVIIADTVNWISISGNFIADGGESYLTVGYFSDVITNDTLLIQDTGFNSYGSYYYFDSLSLVEIGDVNNCDITIANVFTPNNDSNNDFLDFSYLQHIDGLSLTIVNRWGNTVFEYEQGNQIWYGTNQSGNQCSEGVYFYMLKTKTINKTGFIQLIR
jgi:gliding motility-associated-like protein